VLNLNGKTALVTGATGGIGRAIATTLHQQGAKVIITGTKEAKLEELASELGDSVTFEMCNLADKSALEKLMSNHEDVDILVCNAGITKDNLTLRMKVEDFEEVIDINLISTFALNKFAVRRMLKRKWGRIINISSIIGSMGNFGQANYAASKAGIVAMSKSIAKEVAVKGITVNCVAPGFIQTPMTEKLTEEQKSAMLENIPNKQFGKPQDIANVVLFLASKEAGYITGQTLHVNGGMLMV
jgi:3-oxoacyl-[acyl-carrier protein] reductase